MKELLTGGIVGILTSIMLLSGGYILFDISKNLSFQQSFGFVIVGYLIIMASKTSDILK